MSTSKRRRGDFVGFTIHKFPVSLRRAIAAEAERRNSSFQDVAVGALAEKYGVAFTPSGRSSAGVSDTNYVYLSMPRTLRKRIAEHASRRDVRKREVILAALSEHFSAL